MSDERKRDIEETADFIKQLIDQQKSELGRENESIKLQMDQVKKEVIDRSSV